jgi:hypothetical protein
VIGHVAVQAKPTEPAVGQVEMHLFAEPPLGPDPEAIADNQHPDQQLRIDRRSADRTVERGHMRPHAFKVHEPVDRSQHVIGRHMALKRELVKQRRLIDPPITHHGHPSLPSGE